VTETGGVVEEMARARLGTNLRGKWTLDRLLGVGGMAAVYAATHRNGARVAVKMLHPTLATSSRIRERFVREGYVANKVEHPGVVRIIDDDVADDGSAFLVMDLVLGRTLADRARDELLDDEELLDVAEQLLEVLVAAHAKGIVHRDLKPENLLIDAEGKLHVLDFGIARMLEETTGESATKTGHGAGTPGFMAPEQVLGRAKDISPRTDLYAVGATLFALAAGDFVHQAENPQELSIKVATEPARSLGQVAPRIAKDIVALVDRATKMSPDDRFADAKTMLTEVRRLRASLGLSRRVLRPEKPKPIQRVVFAPSEPTSNPGSANASGAFRAPTPGRPPPRPPPRHSTPTPLLEPIAVVPPRRRVGLLAVAGVLVLAVGIGVAVAMKRLGAQPRTTEPATQPSAPSSPSPLEPVGSPTPPVASEPRSTPSTQPPSSSAGRPPAAPPPSPKISGALYPWPAPSKSTPVPRPTDSLGY
jgi:serine/threonine protein kinase